MPKGDYRGSTGALVFASVVTGAIMLVNLWVTAGPIGAMLLSVDRNMLTFFGAAVTYAIAMGIAEQFIRLSHRRRLWPSVAGGLFAFATSFVIWGGLDSFRGALALQSGSIVALLVLLIGSLLGLIHYAFSAPREQRLADDPEIIARALAERPDGAGAGAGETPPRPARPLSAFGTLFGPRLPAIPAVIEAGDRTYFAGPIQVRTSYGLLLLLGVLTALLGMLFIGFLIVVGISLQPIDEAMRGWGYVSGTAVAAWFIFGTLVLSLLLFIPNVIAHHLARVMKVTSTGGYALVAFATALVLCVVFPPLGMFALIPGPFAMAIYCRIVGLEPVGLPNDMIVSGTARDALVGEDHPRRAYRRVVLED